MTIALINATATHSVGQVRVAKLSDVKFRTIVILKMNYFLFMTPAECFFVFRDSDSADLFF